jgi:K+/H+ antiporter YhaU regulatory subunit KhtT
MAVSAANITNAASRLLSQRLVSTEIDYIQRTLGTSSTQQQIDATVMAVRKLPWSSIVIPD